MAKKKTKIDSYDDFDLDAAFAELDEMGFGEAEPPKNSREAVTRSLKDIKRGAIDEVKLTKDNVGKFLKAAVPNSLYTEVSDISDAIFGSGGIKEALQESLKEVKKSGKEVKDTLKAVLPKDSKLQKGIDKISEFLGLDNSDDLASQLAANNNLLMEGLQAELQNQFTKESTLSVLQGNIQRKQNASMLDLLSNIQDNTSIIKTFNIEVTNNFYRKSLELQYKTLFTNKQQLEMMTKSYDTFKVQFEAIIKNTSLPEFVKIKRSENFRATMRQNFDNNIQRYLFNENSTIKRIKENMTRRIKYGFENFIQGLQMANMAIGGAADINSMGSEFGMTKSYLAGNALGGFLRNFLAKNIGERLSNTRLGKKAVYGIKDMAADPAGWFGEKLEKVRGMRPKSGLGRTGKSILEWGLGNMKDMASVGTEYRGVTYGRQDPNDVAVFDNRTQTSIVKVIPGLLNKIYGELRSKRDGSNPDDHELIYDYTRQGLFNKNEFKENFKLDFKNKLQAYTKYSASTIRDMYRDYGKTLKKDEIDVVVNNLVAFLMSNKAKVNPSVLINKDFISILPENLKSKALKAGKIIIGKGVENPWIVDMLVSSLSTIRKSIPNITLDLDMLYSTGNVMLGTEMGLMNRNEITQEHYVDAEGVMRFMQSSATGMRYEERGYTTNSINPNNRYNRNKRKRKRGKNKISQTIDSMVSDIKNNDTKETINKLKEEFFSSKEYVTGQVKDFNVWVSNVTGITPEQAQDAINNAMSTTETVTDRLVEKTKTMLKMEKTKDNIQERLMNTVLENPENMEKLRTEFFNSPEFQSGTVTSFPQWLESLGFKSKSGNTFMKILKTCWWLDRKMAGFLLKAPFKGIYNGAKLAWKGGKLAASTGLPLFAKAGWLGATAVPRQLYNVGKEMLGFKVDDGYITHRADRNIVRKGPGLIAKFASLFTLPFRKSKATLQKVAQEMGTSPDTQVLAAGLDAVANQVQALREKDGPMRRAGNWLDRMNIFKKSRTKSDSKEDKSKSQGIIDFMKEHKGLTLGAGMLLVGGLLKSLNLTTDDVKAGVNKVIDVAKGIGKGIGWVIEKVGWVGSLIGEAIDKVGGFLGFDMGKKKTPKLNPDGSPVLDENGNPVYEESGGMKDTLQTAGTVAAAGGALYAVRHPIKTVKKVASLGIELVENVIEFLIKQKSTGNWFTQAFHSIKNWSIDKAISCISENKSVISKAIDKVFGTFSSIKTKLTKFLNAFKSPKILKAVGSAAINKATGKLTTMIAAAATGIGAWVTAAGVAWELGFTLWYMYDKDMSFFSALSYQLLDVDIMNLIDGSDDPNADDNTADNNSVASNIGPNSVSSTPEPLPSSNYTPPIVTPKPPAIPDSVINTENTATKPGGIIFGQPAKDLKPGELPFNVRGSADWQNMHPELVRRWKGMSEEYYQQTGQKLNLNSGKRSLEKQAELYNRLGPGKAAKPNPYAPHIAGIALDSDSAQMNKADKLGLLAKWGLSRPLLKGVGRTPAEPWHVELAEARDKTSFKVTPTTLSKIGYVDPNAGKDTSTNAAAVTDNTADGVDSVSPDKLTQVQPSTPSNNTTSINTPSSNPLPTPSAPSAKEELSLPQAIPSSSPTTTVSAPTNNHMGIDMSVLNTISDTLTQQLRVQMHMAESLATIVSTGSMGGGTPNPKAETIKATPMEPALKISRKQYS